MRDEIDFSDLKAGDLVLIENYRRSRKSVRRVHKTTPKEVVIDWHGDGSHLPRYRKIGGYSTPQGVYRIARIATPKDCAEWKASQARQAQERERRDIEEANLDRKRSELLGLFSGNVNVSMGPHNMWAITISDLTEAEVRSLAKATNLSVGK